MASAALGGDMAEAIAAYEAARIAFTEGDPTAATETMMRLSLSGYPPVSRWAAEWLRQELGITSTRRTNRAAQTPANDIR